MADRHSTHRHLSDASQCPTWAAFNHSPFASAIKHESTQERRRK